MESFSTSRASLRKCFMRSALPACSLRTRRRQHVHLRAVEQFLLQTELAFALGKLFVGEFSVERHDPWTEFLQLLRKHNAAFGKVLAF